MIIGGSIILIVGIFLLFVAFNDRIFSDFALGCLTTGMVMIFVGPAMAITQVAEDNAKHVCEEVIPEKTKLKTEYVPWTDCFVTLPDGQVVPYERWEEGND